MTSTPITLPNGLNVLALAPHVDDIEIGCGATLLWLKRYLQARITVTVFSDHYTVPKGIPRQKEAKHAATLMGYDELQLLQFPDTEFPDHWRDIQRRVAGLREEIGPDLVLAPNAMDTHQDHAVIAEAVAHEFRYGESIWHYEINQFGADQRFIPNVFVDCGIPSLSTSEGFATWCAESRDRSDTLAWEKIYILQSTMHSQEKKPLLQTDVLMAIMRSRAKQGAPQLETAESFAARMIYRQP